jgi:sugar/nucleoside kinase (ribokinase family)
MASSNSTAPHFLVAGEINADLVLSGFSAFPSVGREVTATESGLVLGSASAICASGLARLGNRVTFLGKVGDDFLGRFCLEEMTRAGIDVSRIHVDAGVRTGVTVALSTERDRALVTFAGATTSFSESDVADEALEGADHLHVASFYLQSGLRPGLAGLFRRAHRSGLTTSLDPGHDPEEAWIRDLAPTLSETDLFFPNEQELRGASGRDELAPALAAFGPVRVVAKLGAKGAVSLDVDHRSLLAMPAPSVASLDTTGAGDSFDAGFLHAWLRKESLETCLRYGAAAGALSTRALGGTGSQPTLPELEAFLAGLTGLETGHD